MNAAETYLATQQAMQALETIAKALETIAECQIDIRNDLAAICQAMERVARALEEKK